MKCFGRQSCNDIVMWRCKFLVHLCCCASALGISTIFAQFVLEKCLCIDFKNFAEEALVWLTLCATCLGNEIVCGYAVYKATQLPSRMPRPSILFPSFITLNYIMQHMCCLLSFVAGREMVDFSAGWLVFAVRNILISNGASVRELHAYARTLWPSYL